ncbi:Putative peptidoglycan binding domain-containing protein [Cognatiyoonia koreensis]|uniref:Putative peptidoglycan binding domain-containing protein n=1 Tax=Cognatiyoonia koreensis TaxID=364200 RepID=A0A1I0RIA5_9RHOB|nr:peptidoglycan-binding protein [Cognatiyoonia koreensis]SEW40680.1 Putative peptidoglycan binding domain-containing protein [Cognatiyoonia koreensis]
MHRLLLLTTLLAGPAFAQDAALLLGVDRYSELDRLRNGTDIAEAAGPLARLGFETQVGADPTGAQMQELATRFADSRGTADRMIVGLSGRFATDGITTWLLGADTDEPGLFTVGQDALGIDSLLSVMGAAAGQSILVIGQNPDRGRTYDDLLRTGLGDLDIPQGVTVVIGEPDDAADYLQVIASPGADAIALAKSNRRLLLGGFVPDRLVLVPEDATETPAAPQTVDTAAEDAMWEGAQALDTAEAYLDYLSKYPAGQYVDEAQERISAINREPNRQDRLAEESLALTRNQRRDIQRDLTVLNYNTRGIDGIFGPGTRQAITNWQQQTGFAQTSYLTADQINQLDAQAARRSAEIEAEAARARAEEERRDRAFWQETGAAGDEPGYRAYLDRFPDGLFAGEARNRLDAIEADKLAAAETQDKAGWDRARAIDTIPGYRDYLAAFEDGAFRRAARDRIKEIRRAANSAEASEDAEAAEVELNVDPITARLIEGKLASLGLDPGPADGEFTDETRRALRLYQRDRGLPTSGFLDRGTVSQLLADTIGNITR